MELTLTQFAVVYPNNTVGLCGNKIVIMRAEYGTTWIHSHNSDCNVNRTLCKHNPPYYNL